MATTTVPVVATDAVDTAGLSIATAVPSGSDPRLGTVYNPTSLAAAQPVWFHPLKDGRHLMVMSRRWTAATPAGGTPGLYSSFTEATDPAWVIVRGSSGGTDVPAGGQLISLKTTVDSAQVVAGASRPPEMLWLLYSAQINSEPAAILQRWAIADSGEITLGGEEVLPSTEAVVFDKGIQYATPYLLIYGTDEHGALYRIRKGWSRTGVNKVSTAQALQGPQPGQVWEYYTGSGYSQDPTELGVMQEGVGSAGPVSFGYFNSLVVMSTVVAKSTDVDLAMTSTDADTIAALDLTERWGTIWTSNNNRPWVQDASVMVDLGDTDAGTYLDAGLALQSQLGANPALLGTNNAGVVYVSSQNHIVGSDRSLANSWGVYPISLVG